MNEFVYNNMKSTADAIKKLKMTKIFRNRDVVIVSDEHDLAYSLCGALCLIKRGTEAHFLHLIGSRTAEYADLINELKDIYPNFMIWDSLDAYMAYFEEKIAEEDPPVSEESIHREVIFDFANLRSPMYAETAQRSRKENEIKQILDHCLQYPNNLFQLITCIPSIDEPLPAVTNAIAEREYEVIFRDYPEDSLEKYVIHLENLMRSYESILSRIQVIRLDRVFGPGITSGDNIWVMDILRDMFTNHSVTVYDRDRHDFASASYSKDAMVSILLAMANGRKGNIYHVSSWEISRYQIISNLYDTYPENECTLETVHEGWENERPTVYRMLNARKLLLTHRSKLTGVVRSTKAWALKATAEWYLNDKPYCPRNEINLYYGRMTRIRELLLELLKEVDKICKENDIQYFLSAGTMLGAVRHHGFIPWDDDIDICMLPQDYKKFIAVCPEHLSIDYGYQNFATEPESHYIHDKIRIKNTFFSTKYSNKYPMMNGVYIDIFVYYKTADTPAAQIRHINQVNRSRKLIALRWATRPNIQAKKKWLVRILYPIVQKIPFSWIHKYNQHLLNKYENKNTHYRFDSTGFNLKKVGAIPDEWFHETVEAEFCGEHFPIPAHYDDYLSHWFGKNYMNLLPVASRKSVHDVVRIDLGQYLFDETKHDPRFRDVNIKGELFEKIPACDRPESDASKANPQVEQGD